MKPEIIERMVLKEIGDNWDLTNARGLDLRRCLLRPPRKNIYEDLVRPDMPLKLELWTVLHENPEGKGYSIVYSDSEQQYGLATDQASKSLGGFMGFYGTFMQTFMEM